jgi:type VI secretion system secreted protein Hcp
MSYSNDSEREMTDMKLTFEWGDKTEESQLFLEPITILAWSFGSSAGIDPETKKDQVYLQDLSMTKYVTEQSPLFLKFITEKKIFKTVILECTNKNQTIKFKMADAFLSSISTGGSGGESNLTENITLSYNHVEFSFDRPGSSTSKSITSGLLLNKDPGNYGRRY